MELEFYICGFFVILKNSLFLEIASLIHSLTDYKKGNADFVKTKPKTSPVLYKDVASIP